LNNNTYTVEANSVIAYPNPFNETLSFRIQAKEYANASITFFDASGRVVLEEKNKVSEGVNWMNIENSNALPTGLVLYTIQIGDEITRGKIFKLK
jgi:predicted deacylase